jgi:hypothetical protein
MEEQNLPKKEGVFLIFILTVITLGIYGAYWYIKNSDRLNNLNTQKKISKGLAISFLVFLVISFSINIIGNLIQPNSIELNNQIPTQVYVMLIGFIILFLTTIIISIILAFKTRSILNEIWANKNVNRTVSWLFTLFLNLYYLQYEINRTLENKENESRVGPWIWFIIILLSPIIIITIIGLMIIIASLILSGF